MTRLLIAAAVVMVVLVSNVRADTLYCEPFGKVDGVYADNITNANIGSFITNDGNKILFSFNACQIEFNQNGKE